MAAKYAGRATFAKIDCTEGANKELASKMGIRATPMFLVYKDGEVEAVTAGVAMDKLEAAVEATVKAVAK